MRDIRCLLGRHDDHVTSTDSDPNDAQVKCSRCGRVHTIALGAVNKGPIVQDQWGGPGGL